ncbi:hypothetical protein [Marinomonas ostreistagni]|uniref:Lipoprotein n=1 Tax=Marinomonas ostreistagni TaxID=359209 RepID=A0ABS0ZAT5_9GAMM|nr:hypothetical protein [Marinomonas ostreistagni]MBJ7550760.1 hypothetical protein [Marinomonas ostreistagni]
MKVYFLGVTVAFLLSGCASGLQVDKISPIDTEDKTISLMNDTRWNIQIRRALLKEGFNVKRFSTVKELSVVTEQYKETYNLAEATYGLTVSPGPVVDWCLGGSAEKFSKFSLELTDLRTNQPVLFVEQGGWTDTCLGMFGNLFPDLAKAINENWN